MEFRVEALGPCRKRVAVTVPPERVAEEYDRQYDEVNESVVVPGFRKGRAPRRILEKRFGTQLGRDVKEKLVQGALERLLEEKKVEPLKAPELDLEALELEPEKAFEFEFEVVTKPEFETPEYKGLEVEVPPVEVAEEHVDAAVDRLRRAEAVLETVEDAQVADGDVLVVDWRLMEGESVEARDDHVFYPFGRGVIAGLVASDLDEQLRDGTPGVSATSKVQVPADDPREELRNRELDLVVTLKEVKRYVLPEIDEAFLKRHDYDDEAEMRADVRKRVLRALRRERERLAEERLVEKLVGGIEMSLPEEFVSQELENWARRQRVGLQMEGVAEEAIEKRIAEGRSDAKTSIEADMRRFFLLDRIAEAEQVEVTEAEMAGAIQEIARAYGRPEDEVLTSFRDGGRLGELKVQISHRKVRELIRREATLVEVEGPPPEGEAEEAKAPAPAKGRKKAAPRRKKAAAKAASPAAQGGPASGGAKKKPARRKTRGKKDAAGD